MLSRHAMLSQVSDSLEPVHKIQVSSLRQHFFQVMSPFSLYNWKHPLQSRQNCSNIRRALRFRSPVYPRTHEGHHYRSFVTFF
jgi:hypothetical protein